MTVIRERDIAYNLLETGKTGEPTPQIRYDLLKHFHRLFYIFIFSETSFGLSRYYQPKERILPFYKNRYYQLLWGKRKPAVCIIYIYFLNLFLLIIYFKSWTNIFKRRHNEFQEHQEHQETNRIRKIVANVLQKYPHLRNEEERVLEEYKKRYDFEHYSIPKRLARRPKLRAHQTVWNEQEFIEKGILEDPNNEDFEHLQQEKAVRMRRKKK